MRVRVEGEIVAARQVPHTMSQDELIWKAQVKVLDSERVDPDPKTGAEYTWLCDRVVINTWLCDRVEITYPIRPPIGHKVRFTATDTGDGKVLSNPRGIAQRQDALGKWHRIGG